jgi:hypothetical protein
MTQELDYSRYSCSNCKKSLVEGLCYKSFYNHLGQGELHTFCPDSVPKPSCLDQFAEKWQQREQTRAREWSSPSPSTTTTTSPDSTPTTLPLPTRGYLLSFDQARGHVTLIRRTTNDEIDRRELNSTSQRSELLALWVSLNELATCWMKA